MELFENSNEENYYQNFDGNFHKIYLEATLLFYKQQINNFPELDFSKNIKENIDKLNRILEDEYKINNKTLIYPEWINEIINLDFEVFKFYFK